MPHYRNRRPRAVLLLSAAALFAVPAIAQTDTAAPAAAAPNVSPPPVVRTVSGADAVPVDPQAAAQAAAEDAARGTARPAARRTAAPVARRAPVRPQRVAETPRAAAPAAVAPSAPAAPAATAAATPTAPVAANPAPAAAAPVATRTQQTQQTARGAGVPVWAIVLAGLVLLGGLAAFLMRRRNRDEELYAVEAADPVYEEPAYVEPAYVKPARAEPAYVAPVAAAPVLADEPRAAGVPVIADVVAAEPASVETADSDDVAALTAADAPAGRPWLEFAMRPVRAGTNVDEALVEIELTVANAGAVSADDVRVSTFMLAAGSDSEMERLLIAPRDDEAIAPLTIAPGEGARVDATLAMNRALLAGDAEHATFQPMIVADVRYRLPDGSEARTSASFLVGGTPERGAALEPIELDRVMLREDVEAQLYRTPERV